MSKLDALYEEIEKARGKGLIPRGGSSRMRGVARREIKTQAANAESNRRLLRAGDRSPSTWGARDRAMDAGERAKGLSNYLGSRKAGAYFRGGQNRSKPTIGYKGKKRNVYKSIEALDAEIEKAAMRFPDGMRRMSRRQIRNVKTQNAKDGEIRAGKRSVLAGDSTAHSVGPNRRGSGGKKPPAERLSALRAKRGYKFKFSSTFGRKGYGGVRKSDDISKAKPKTLYVFRPLLNAEQIITWAKAQGFGSTLEASDMHATIAFSKTPLNWAKLGDDWCAEDPRPGEGDERRYAESVSWSDGGRKQRTIEGGAREVKALGDKGAIVLAFQSPSLTERWAQFIRIGASWDYAGYTPHITITYKGGSVDLSKVEPYKGPIILGEEDWNEIKEGAGDNIPEAVTKAELDALNARLAAVEKAQAAPAKEAA